MPKITLRKHALQSVALSQGVLVRINYKNNIQKSVAHPEVSKTLKKSELHMHKKSMDSQEVSESSEVHYIGERSKK